MTNSIYHKKKENARGLAKTNRVCYSTKVTTSPLTCGQLLTEHFIAYKARLKQDIDQKDFAKYIGIHEVTLALLINNKKPLTSKMAVKLATVLDDPRFYEIVNAKPALKTEKDPLQGYVDRNWDSAPEEIKQEIAKLVASYTSEPLPSKNVAKNHATN